MFYFKLKLMFYFKFYVVTVNVINCYYYFSKSTKYVYCTGLRIEPRYKRSCD